MWSHISSVISGHQNESMQIYGVTIDCLPQNPTFNLSSNIARSRAHTSPLLSQVTKMLFWIINQECYIWQQKRKECQSQRKQQHFQWSWSSNTLASNFFWLLHHLWFPLKYESDVLLFFKSHQWRCHASHRRLCCARWWCGRFSETASQCFDSSCCNLLVRPRNSFVSSHSVSIRRLIRRSVSSYCRFYFFIQHSVSVRQPDFRLLTSLSLSLLVLSWEAEVTRTVRAVRLTPGWTRVAKCHGSCGD